MEEYNKLLKRCIKKLPPRVKEKSRFKVPEVEVAHEGNNTILKNLGDIGKAVNRDVEHLYGYLLKEIGTAGVLKGGRAIFKGKLLSTQIAERVRRYVDTFVLCYECNRPDTHIEKVNRVLTLRCDACGAHRPVVVRKKPKKRKTIEEGKNYRVKIVGQGKKGDGVAREGALTIFVPNAKKGESVDVRIERISGKVAFAKLV